MLPVRPQVVQGKLSHKQPAVHRGNIGAEYRSPGVPAIPHTVLARTVQPAKVPAKVASAPALPVRAHLNVRPVVHNNSPRPAFVRGAVQPFRPAVRNGITNAFPGAPVIQPALKRGLSIGTLDQSAVTLNQARTGQTDTRNTQAVSFGTGGSYTAYSQREYLVFDDAITELEQQHGVTIGERVIGDSPDDEGIHAEMLAVSEWLVGNQEKPLRLGVSQPVCARCQAILDILGIAYGNPGGQYTQNWVHPLRHAANARTVKLSASVVAKLKQLPQKVTRGREYDW
jgi:hypothetical protein